MPKRKWTRLHDDPTIAEERRHRSRELSEQQEARVTIDEGVAEVLEQRRPETPAAVDEAGTPGISEPQSPPDPSE